MPWYQGDRSGVPCHPGARVPNTVGGVWGLGIRMSPLDTTFCTPRVGVSKYRWSWIMITYHIHTLVSLGHRAY